MSMKYELLAQLDTSPKHFFWIFIGEISRIFLADLVKFHEDFGYTIIYDEYLKF